MYHVRTSAAVCVCARCAQRAFSLCCEPILGAYLQPLWQCNLQSDQAPFGTEFVDLWPFKVVYDLLVSGRCIPDPLLSCCCGYQGESAWSAQRCLLSSYQEPRPLATGLYASLGKLAFCKREHLSIRPSWSFGINVAEQSTVNFQQDSPYFLFSLASSRGWWCENGVRPCRVKGRMWGLRKTVRRDPRKE